MITLFSFGRLFGLPDPSPFVTKVEILLKMAAVPYRLDTTGFNKAPKGKLPYIDDDGTIVGDSTFIRWHLEKRHGADFDKGLSPAQKASGWAMEKMCEDHLYWAIVDSRWIDRANFDKGPRKFFDQAPAPVRPFVVAMVMRRLKRNLKGHGMGRHQRAEIERLAIADIDAIAAILGTQPWMSGPAPTGVDATAWAFIASVLCPLFESPIRTAAEGHANLVAYRDRGLALWYPELKGEAG